MKSSNFTIKANPVLPNNMLFIIFNITSNPVYYLLIDINHIIGTTIIVLIIITTVTIIPTTTPHIRTSDTLLAFLETILSNSNIVVIVISAINKM